MDNGLDVLIVVHNPTRQGGAYFRARGLARPLTRRGHRVTVMAIHPKDRLKLTVRELDGFALVETPDLLPGIGRSGWDPWDTLRRTLWIRQHHFDIIHTIDTRPAVCIPALMSRRASGAKWVADWTDWWGRGGAATERDSRLISAILGPIEQFFEERPRLRADGTVVISEALSLRAEGLGIPRSEQLRLPPGADPDDIRDLTSKEARTQLGLSDDEPLLGYLGNIYPRDAELLFDAMRRLRNPARLLMIGEPGVTVPDDLRDRVEILGRVPFQQMLTSLCACNVAVLPLTDSIANRGRWPSKINEYVAVGRPTVACAVGDIAELIEDNCIGLLSAPEPSEFAARIDQLLDDELTSTAMGDRARELARTSYSQDAVAERLEAYYHQILSSDPQ